MIVDSLEARHLILNLILHPLSNGTQSECNRILLSLNLINIQELLCVQYVAGCLSV